MSVDELLDLVNEKDEVIGTVWKSEAHKEPSKIHREVAIAVFNNKGEVLIQQRSMNKLNDPGEWKITAAGHVEAGENPKNAAEREVKEELGIRVKALFYKKIFSKRVNKIGSTESRFFYVYYSIIGEKPRMKLNRKEVMGAEWVKPEILDSFARTHNWDVKGLSHQM